MSDHLHQVFVENEKDLVRDLMEQLKHSPSPYYSDLPWDALHQRVESLVAYFLISLDETPHQFIKYVSGITEERIAEGYPVGACLSALRLLEEKAWLIVVQFIPQQQIIRALSRITSTIGEAKDTMARIYVSHLERPRDAVSAPVGFTD